MNNRAPDVVGSVHDHHQGLQQRIRRLRGRIEREGAAKIVSEALGRLVRPLVERVELVYIELELGPWEPRLTRRGKGTDVVEVTTENQSEWTSVLGETESRFARDQFAQNARVFIAVRSGELAGVVGAARRYEEAEWNVVCEVQADELILFRVSVMEAFRRGATGGVLVEKVLEKLKAERIIRVVGVIKSANRPSLILSENLGYSQYQRQRMYRLFSSMHTAPRIVEGAKAKFSGRRTGAGERAASA